jgi:hypothetical protein
VQITILRNKSEVVLHRLSGDFSEQIALHREGSPELKKTRCPKAVSPSHT